MKRTTAVPNTWTARIGDALDAAMYNRGATLEDVAACIGVHASSVSRMLAGRQPVTFDVLAKIADYLEVSRRALLQSAGYITNDEHSDLVDISHLDPQARAAVEALVGPRRRW